MIFAQHILVFAIRLYQRLISPVLVFLFGPSTGCRFTPTCSQYSLEAVKSHGIFGGSFLAAKRLCRCHPWGGCGHDPVPDPEQKCLSSAQGRAEQQPRRPRSQSIFNFKFIKHGS